MHLNCNSGVQISGSSRHTCIKNAEHLHHECVRATELCDPCVSRETIRVLGLLGALDPYRKKTLHQESNEECLVIPDPDTTDTMGKAGALFGFVGLGLFSQLGLFFSPLGYLQSHWVCEIR